MLSLRLGDVIATDELRDVLRTWFLSDLTGVIVVTPAILTWVWTRPGRISRLRAAEAAVLVVALVLLAELVDSATCRTSSSPC